MPRAIAIETSGRVGSVAVVDNQTVVDQETFEHGFAHAAGLLPMIDRLVRKRGWTPTDVEEIYVSVGPGSFTGLRIGITLAKTLAMTTGAKLVAVPTVDVLARNAPAGANHLLIVLDAKRDQIFTARFERDDDGWLAREPAHLGSLVEELSRCPRPVHLLGEGVPFHRKFVPANDGVTETGPETWRAKAEHVAAIGLAMSAAGQFIEPDALLPIYIRRPEAEEKYEARSEESKANADDHAELSTPSE